MKSYSMLLLVAVLAVGCLSACSDSTSPPKAPKLTMTLDGYVDESGAEPIYRVEATVKNTGRLEVLFPEGCPDRVGFRVEDEEGRPLSLHHPLLDLICPPAYVHLGPGDEIDSTISLDEAYDSAGNRYPIPPGEYLVQATFAYFQEEDPEYRTIVREMTVTLE